jgi:hypothetical protein
MLVSDLAAGHDPNSIFGLPAWASIASEISVVVILIWIIVSLRHRAEEKRERAWQSRRPYMPSGPSNYPSDAERLIRDHEIWLEEQARWERQREDSGKLFKYWTSGDWLSRPHHAVCTPHAGGAMAALGRTAYSSAHCRRAK